MEAPTRTGGDDVVRQTERLTLRRVRPGDEDIFLSWRSRPDVMRYIYLDPWTEETARERIASWATGPFAEPGDVLMLAVEGPVGVVGEALLKWAPGEGQTEIGYAFHPDAAGFGFATEAGRALLSVAFEQYEFHRAFARIDAENIASIRVAQRLGMRLEARHVESARRPSDGAWASELVFALLVGEFVGRRPPPGPSGAAFRVG